MSNHKKPVSPPTKIEKVKVDKVYNECKQLDINRIEIDLPVDEDFEEIIDIKKIQCLSTNLIDKKCKKVGKNRLKLWIKYEVNYMISNEVFTALEIFDKTVILQRLEEKELKLQCEVFLKCLDAFIKDETTIVIRVGKMLIFKLYAPVQLFIPAYGFAPQPEECKEKVLEDCPEYLPIWPPYPKQ